MKRIAKAVVLSVLTVGFVAVVVAELWPPTLSLRRMVAYLVTMVALGVVVVNPQ